MGDYNLTETVGLEEFLVDYHSDSDTIEVPAQWLQRQLREAHNTKRDLLTTMSTNSKLIEQSKRTSNKLRELYEHIEFLNSIAKINPSRTRMVLDITI